MIPGIVWTAAVTGLSASRILGKILIDCWRLALRINKDGTTKMRKQRNEKNEKTDILHKKWRKQKKAGTVPQVTDGGGAQVGTSEGPGR